MGEESLATVPFDRAVEQAIVTLKKGAYLLRCGRRGKPKFCPFRLSTDEKFLIWYSGQEEKQLRLSSITKIIPGQRTVNFQRQLQEERECRSFSLVYANGERSLDLICKDKAQADSWFLGLKAVISRCQHPRQLSTFRNCVGVQTCFNSPAGYFRRKHNLGLLEDTPKFSQVRSLCGSPTQSLSERCFSDGLSYSADSFYSSESSVSNVKNVADVSLPSSPYVEPDHLKQGEEICAGTEIQTDMLSRVAAPSHASPQMEKNDILRDVMIWGEGIEGGILGGGVYRFGNQNGMQSDALLPKLLESTTMLDVREISLGGKHAALVTKQGEVFCWGEGSGGRLGHKVNMDMGNPKIVESLTGVLVKSVSCGEYQTCALTHSGELYTWGDNGSGIDLVGERRKRSQWIPSRLSGPLNGTSISNVACGEWHMAIVSTSGQLFTYGDGTFGVLGHGKLESISQPKEVESLSGLWVKAAACGPWHTAAIVEVRADRLKFNTKGGKLFTWGDGDKGRLGHGDQERKLLPTCVAQLVDHDFVQVSCGRMLTVGLTCLGTVYTMGSAVHGQLGNPQAKDKSIAIVGGKLKDEFVKEISSGSYHVAALTSKGSLYTWGMGANGQLGLGDTEDRNSPTVVEALRDRQVESIACGSNFTAAICLHKSISSTDQSACSGCRMAFGFTRKKHNCYNCGLLFCRACSNKKFLNASLAPNKKKPFRVCDPCYTYLQRIKHSSRLLKLENHSPRQLLMTQKTSFDEKEDRGEGTPARTQFSSVGQPCNEESQSYEKKPFKNQVENQQTLEPVSSLSNGLPRWGQVPCPFLFEKYCRENSIALVPLSNNQLSSVPLCWKQSPRGSKYMVSTVVNMEKDFPDTDKILIEEVERLRSEARSLEKLCQMRSEKIQECQQKLQETWSLAREEAAKCKAAKEVIKALSSRLHTMSEKLSSERDAKDGIDSKLPQIITRYADTPKERQLDSLCGSPIVFSNSLRSMYGRDECQGHTRSVEDSCLEKIDPRQNGTRPSKLEWVEQYEPGVYITFITLASGQRGLKRVRFSRKRFTEKEAERWWEENQIGVYQNYGIEGYISSSQNKMKG
ncbi:PH, RCC1 and FYVE domains-containing protein 1 [Vitis riparia]|uniref:PH, RCC1 and FYVE domains-containing protein 1 n=1 Tax=Vitis riparia TaxID=96939 RepID=UPI00155A8335|nr:PH, RCC1 and FYVE domains-containing protein 1 [Vitis riparia]